MPSSLMLSQQTLKELTTLVRFMIRESSVYKRSTMTILKRLKLHSNTRLVSLKRKRMILLIPETRLSEAPLMHMMTFFSDSKDSRTISSLD